MGFRRVDERGYWGGQDLILITLDRQEYVFSFSSSAKGQTTQTTPLTATRYYTYLCTGNVNHTVSCTRPSKIAAKGVGVPHLGATGRGPRPKTWEGPRTRYILCNKYQDKPHPLGYEEYLRTSVGDFWGLTRSTYTTLSHVTGPHEINQGAASPHTVLTSTICRIRLSAVTCWGRYYIGKSLHDLPLNG